MGIKMISKYFRAAATCILLWGATNAQAGIVGSKHDLTMNAGVQLCVHCHTPHNASTQEGLADGPLWNRKITNLDAFTLYASPTMTQASPHRPSGISLVCLSCHDGASSKGASAVHSGDQHYVINSPKTGGPVNTGSDADGQACIKCHTGTYEGIYSKALSVMGGPDLRNDHPISIPYPVANSNYQTPPDAAKGWADLKLFVGRVECPSCHAVHDPSKVPFLRMNNSGSAMCLTCHNK
ncbi:MAG: cytochrome c3 family protein [Thiobacillus sp.]|nr:cytochrome c3 family protein [Thiobacillus sp.]